MLNWLLDHILLRWYRVIDTRTNEIVYEDLRAHTDADALEIARAVSLERFNIPPEFVAIQDDNRAAM